MRQQLVSELDSPEEKKNVYSILNQMDIFGYSVVGVNCVNPLKGRDVSWLHFAIQV